MQKVFYLLLLVGVALARHHHGDDDDSHEHEDGDGYLDNNVRDYDRACLEGFFYAGEPRDDLPPEEDDRDWEWTEGERTPVYSCYSIIQVTDDEEPMTLSGATLRCNDMRGELLSVNDTLEAEILTGQGFTSRLEQGDLQFLTSAMNLGDDNWIWFGADQDVDHEIVEGLIHKNNKDSNQTSNCVLISWELNENSTYDLVYTTVPCTSTFTHAICEVRVYTQTWYVWLGANWLQILFFFTLAVLLFSCCCLCQSWFWRSHNHQPTGTIPRPRVIREDLPPSYSDLHPSQGNNQRGMVSRVGEKGKEILAKVIYYRPGTSNPEKQPIPE